MNLKRARRLRDSGLPWHEVAKRLGITIYKLRMAWEAAGYPADKRYHLKNRKVFITAAVLTKAAELRRTGMQWKRIGKELNVCWATLYNVFRRQVAGTTSQPEIVTKAIEMRAKGFRWKAIGRALDVDSERIASQVRYHNKAISHAEQ